MNDNAFANALNGIAEAAEKNRKFNQGDYYDDDDLLHCGVCGQPKEHMIDKTVGAIHIYRKVGCMCKCEQDRIQKQREEEERKEQLERVRRARTASLMDERFMDARFESTKQTKYNSKNLALCKRYADSFDLMVEKNQGLLFWGDVGTGKSYAAACIANQLVDNHVDVIMTSFVKLLQVFRDPDEEDRLSSRLMNAKLVIFDDLGSERGTDYAMEKVYNIVDSRYRSNLPMIVTTNLTLNEMLQSDDLRYKRIFDRVFEVCYPMQWTGPSWRKMEARNRFDEMAQILGADKWQEK